MKWLQDNPVGVALASVSGVFVLIAVAMAIVWNLPVAVDMNEIEVSEESDPDVVLAASPLADLDEFKIIDERPVFNVTRLPVIDEVVEEEALTEDVSIAVKDPPDVRLTGVIITPEMKIATLTPSKNETDLVMAHEGESLTGEFVGWKVGRVNSRAVVLNSSDGQQLRLELQVHDQAIKEPPKPVKPVAAKPVEEQLMGEDGQPMSRAEQIRQRIADRREELRLEQEQLQEQEEAQAARAAPPSDYQKAILNMMSPKKKDSGNNDKNGG